MVGVAFGVDVYTAGPVLTGQVGGLERGARGRQGGGEKGHLSVFSAAWVVVTGQVGVGGVGGGIRGWVRGRGGAGLSGGHAVEGSKSGRVMLVIPFSACTLIPHIPCSRKCSH